jgi:hypothetical protein
MEVTEIVSDGKEAEEPHLTVCLLAVNSGNDAKVSARVGALLEDQATVLTLHSPTDIYRELERLPQA